MFVQGLVGPAEGEPPQTGNAEGRGDTEMQVMTQGGGEAHQRGGGDHPTIEAATSTRHVDEDAAASERWDAEEDVFGHGGELCQQGHNDTLIVGGNEGEIGGAHLTADGERERHIDDERQDRHEARPRSMRRRAASRRQR